MLRSLDARDFAGIVPRVRDVLLTGVPRSGTTLTCELVNLLPDARALDEPLPVGRLVEQATLEGGDALDYELICREIAELMEAQRRSILERGVAVTRHVRGRVSGRRIADVRDRGGARQRLGELGEVAFERPRSPDFTLVVKHPVLFTALLGVLRGRFEVFTVVRNPLAVMGSWESVPMMVRAGELGLPAAVAPELARRLTTIEDLLERQLCLLDWYFRRYAALLAPERILRYEEIVASGGAALATMIPAAAELRAPLEGRNVAPVYDHTRMLEVGRRLLGSGPDASWRSFYSDNDVESLMEAVASSVPAQGVPAQSVFSATAARYGTDKGREPILVAPEKVHSAKRYTDSYALLFGPLRERAITLLEIGVAGGASLRMWEQLFPLARIVGIDVNPACSRHASERSAVYIGDQSDAVFLGRVIEREGPFDLVIDDGGHTMEQHAASLAALWGEVRPGGFYAIEDLHTAYDERYGGSNGRAASTTIEWLKGLVDRINGRGDVAPQGDGIASAGALAELADDLAGLWLAQGLAILVKGE
jgi:predicted O-methyltransferase YrrM